MIVLNSVLGSSLPSAYTDVLGRHFNITNEEQLVLPISVWLMGYVVGPLIFGICMMCSAAIMVMLNLLQVH